MSNGANDWRNCTNCRYAIWEKDEVLACHRRAPRPNGDWPMIFCEVDDCTFCWEYRPWSFWWNVGQAIRWWWKYRRPWRKQ